MMETSWEMNPFRRRKRTARRQMGCYLAPGPAPEHLERKAFAGKTGPLFLPTTLKRPGKLVPGAHAMEGPPGLAVLRVQG